MGQFDLNLSTRPFRPYRAANLALFAVLAVLAVISARQVYNYRQYSSLAAEIRDSQRQAKEEADRLQRDLQTLNAKVYSGSSSTKMTEVEFLNQLLLRKSFSWTRVFANLERVMPDNVHLLNLRPFIEDKGMIGLNITVRGKSFTDGADFVRTLEDSAIFDEVVVAVEEKKEASTSGEVEFVLSTNYFPERRAE